MELILFYLVGAVTVGLSLAMIMSSKPVTSAVCLVCVMFLLAVLFAMLDASLIAALQVLVYAGAIMVLFLFVIMLLNLREKEGTGNFQRTVMQVIVIVVFGAMLVPFMLPVIVGDGAGTAVSVGFGSAGAVGRLLYTNYLLPFEIASILLLAALVGAVALAMNKKR